jgi:MinD-like ATPase involved in chromosome partitioning or flagellar assembly
MGLVVTVSGAVGGIGTSTFAYALALQQQGASVLMDVQPDGAPLDLVIGAERESGTRWRQVHVTTDIKTDAVLAALPQWQGVHFLSSDREATANPGALVHLVEALREDHLVVLDIDARNPAIESIRPDARVLLVPNTIFGLGAALATVTLASSVVIVASPLPDLTTSDLQRYLPQSSCAVLQHERGVWQAMRNGMTPPTSSSVMTAAKAVFVHATGTR